MPNLDDAIAPMQRQTVFNRERRKNDLELRGLRHVPLDKPGGFGIARALLISQFPTGEALVLLQIIAQQLDQARPAVHRLFAVRRAGGGKVFERARVADELYAREGFAPDLIADDLLLVPVRIDDVPDWLGRQLTQRSERLFSRGEADIRVNDDHVIVIDDEYVVRLEPQAQRLLADQRVYAFGDFLDFKGVLRFPRFALLRGTRFKCARLRQRDARRQRQEKE